MKQGILISQVLPVVLEGSSRRALPDDSVGELAALSLLGQALQFEKPVVPDAFVAEVEIPDERRVLPDGLRRPLIRFLQGKLATDHPALALARAFERSRLRPHPFDLPALDSFVRSYAESLGAMAQHWAKRQDAAVETFHISIQRNWTKQTGRRLRWGGVWSFCACGGSRMPTPRVCCWRLVGRKRRRRRDFVSYRNCSRSLV